MTIGQLGARAKDWICKILEYSPVIAAILLFAATLALCYLCSPSADDFRGSLQFSDLPNYIITNYYNHSGRWFELTLDIALFPRSHFHTLYPAYLVVLIVLYYASLYSFIGRLMGAGGTVAQRPSIAAVFLALFIAGMPSIGQTLFWVSGAISSVMPVFCTLYLLGLLLWPPVRPPTRILCAILFFGAFLIAGLHEMFALILCIVLGTGLVSTIPERNTNRTLWVAAFAGAALGTVVVVLAPGNTVRAANLSVAVQHASWIKIASYTAGLLVRDIVNHWLVDLKLMAATYVFVWHPAIRGLCPNWLRDAGTRGKVLVLTGSLLAVALPLLLPQFALSTVFLLPGRTLDGLYAVFLMAWFATIFVFTRPTSGIPPSQGSPGKPICLFASVILAASFLQAPNSVTMYKDLWSRAIPWKSAIDARMRALAAAKANHSDQLVVPSLDPIIPRSFFYQDVVANPDDLRNQSVARYYGIHKIMSH